MGKLRSPLVYTLVGLASVAILVKIIPVIRFGQFAFGYDSGFYRRYLIEPLILWPNTPVPGLDHTVFIPRLILDAIRVVIMQPDIALYGTYIVVSLLGTLVFWFFLREFLPGEKSVYAIGLNIISGIQFLAFKEFFLKEAFALPLFLLAIYSFQKRKYFLAALLGVLIVLTQQTSAILIICIGGLGFLIRSITERTVSTKYVFSGTIILASYLFLHPHVAAKLASPPVGVFLTQTEYLLLSIPLILLSLIGMRKSVSFLKDKPLLIASLCVPLAFAVFHLPFYNRIYEFLDLFLVIPATFGVEELVKLVSSYGRMWRGAVIGIVVLIVSAPLIYLQTVQVPLIPKDVQDALPQLGKIPSEAAIITSPTLLPWVQGWTLASVYAPGNLKEPHTTGQWQTYWSHQSRELDMQFLQTFPNPLYVFVGSNELQYRPPCAKELSTDLYSLESCL